MSLLALPSPETTELSWAYSGFVTGDATIALTADHYWRKMWLPIHRREAHRTAQRQALYDLACPRRIQRLLTIDQAVTMPVPGRETSWIPVTIALTHECPALTESLVGGLRRQRKPVATSLTTFRRDDRAGRYSSRCTWQKIEHTPAIECHGWRCGRVLRWIIDTDSGVVA